MTSLLGRIKSDHVRDDPFPYLTTTEALAPGDYETLSARFPVFPPRPELADNNLLAHISGLHAFADEIPIDPVWQDFMRHHYSTAFLQEMVAHLGDGVRRVHPGLEDRLGKRLEDLTAQPRNTDDQGADVWIDVQFAINTPVKEESRVRSRHVDDPKKLFAGLFYMRAPEDSSIGGDLEICRWRGEPRFQSVFVHDQQVDLVDTITYRANTLLVFVNSALSVHGVTRRPPTPHFRRYINILAEFREPIFELPQNRETGAPWALMMGGNKD